MKNTLILRLFTEMEKHADAADTSVLYFSYAVLIFCCVIC